MTFQRKQLGASGEDLAAEFLEKLGYKIINRNLRFKVGEIDILAQDNKTIVIVEVKTKRFVHQGLPEEQVDYFKKKKLRLLGRAISQQYLDQPIRIDVIAIDETDFEPKINHIINAVTC
jgi:putative endonuclease